MTFPFANLIANSSDVMGWDDFVNPFWMWVVVRVPFWLFRMRVMFPDLMLSFACCWRVGMSSVYGNFGTTLVSGVPFDGVSDRSVA